MSRSLPRPRPGRPFLRRGQDRIQLGLDPRTAVVVDRLSPEAGAALMRLDGTVPRGDLAAAVPGLGRLLDQLDERQLLDDDPGAAAVSEHRRRRHAADLLALALASSNEAAVKVLARRGRSTVVVRGNDRAAAQIAVGLAAAGVGTVTVQGPDRTTGPHDLTPAGPHEPDVSWRDEVSSSVRRWGAHPVSVSVRGTRPSAVVVCSAADVDLPWTDPELADDLLADGIPHLAVAVSGGSARIGPFVLPGLTACLWCLDHRMRDADAAWPALADQVRLRHPEAAASLGTVAAAAAAVAVAHLLQVVDGGPDARPASADAQIELRAPDLLARAAAVSRHPVCGCGWELATSTMVG